MIAMRDKILVLASQPDKHLGLFSDLDECSKAILHYVEPKSKRFLPSVLRRLHMSRRLLRWKSNRPIPFQYIWYDYGKGISLECVKAMLVGNACVDKVNVNFLLQCKKLGIQIYLLILDSVDSESLTVIWNKSLYFSNIWDKVFSFDPVDANKYGFTYKGFCFYSKNKFYPTGCTTNYDVYFTGNTKGDRAEMINGSFGFLTKNGCKCLFDVQLQHKRETKIEGINYVKRWISYQEVLKRLSQCKCILEVVQKNQNGPSLRYFEAIFYNKKLLTNNKNITTYPYYDSRWMRVIEKPEEIDVEWVRNSDDVNYQYKGEFSPVNFINYLLEL